MAEEYVIGHVPGFEQKCLSKKVGPKGHLVIALFLSEEAVETFIADCAWKVLAIEPTP